MNPYRLAILCLLANIASCLSSAVRDDRRRASPEDGARGGEEEEDDRTVSTELFRELEELSRLIGISYCVGYQGIQKPFECLSHCAGFKNFELVETFDSGLLDSATCGYIALSHAPNPPRIIVAFRGSNSLSDAISDLMTLPAEYTPYQPPEPNGTAAPLGAATASGGRSSTEQTAATRCEGCQVHEGFLSAWHTIRDAIMPALRDAVWKYKGYQLVVAGHSLGGAIAGLASLEFAAMGWDPAVTTFGEPRWGNAPMVDFVDGLFPAKPGSTWKYHRVTHVGDPVPLYPLESWGWRMHGGEIYIDKSALPPKREDVRWCEGQQDPSCIEGESTAASFRNQAEVSVAKAKQRVSGYLPGLPTQWKLWEILFAHREYFWRIGLCWDPQSGGYMSTSSPDEGLVEGVEL